MRQENRLMSALQDKVDRLQKENEKLKKRIDWLLEELYGDENNEQ